MWYTIILQIVRFEHFSDREETGRGEQKMGIHEGHRQRKKEQFLKNGLGSFADHEVLELLLYYAIPRRDTNELAHQLMERFGSLNGVLNAVPEELQKVSGIGENAATLLHLVPAVMCRAAEKTPTERILNSVERSGSFFMDLLSGQRREALYQVCLDAKGKVLSYSQIASGTVDSVTLNVREIVENALHADASAVLLGHNHPSGIALPSAEDRSMTLQVRQALETMGIQLVDHIIVADGDFVSMAASGLLL